MKSRSPLAVMLAAMLLLPACAPNPYGEPNPTGIDTTTVDPFTLPTPQHLYNLWPGPDRQVLPVPDVVVPGYADPPPGSGYTRYLEQQVRWQPCDEQYECATVLVPLDWYEPDGQAITIAMKRLPASAEPRLGSLFINPGGPGGSAQDYVEYFTNDGLEQFDIVGVDPRGSGESTGVVCGTTEQTDAFYELDSSPSNEAERSAVVAGARAFAKQCREGSGALLDHITTIEAVYDFDLIRQLLGDEKFNYLGVSYGTYIGSVYAELYPENAGHLVLDAATNITDRPGVSQSDGFELALQKWIEWYVANSTTHTLGNTANEVLQTLTTWMESLDGNPIPVGDRRLTQSLAVTGLALYFYLGTDVYKTMTDILEYTVSSNDGEYLLYAADLLNGREEDHWDQSGLSFPAIACIDGGDDGINDSWASWNESAERAPFFGRFMGVNMACPVWSTPPAPQIDFSGAGAPPLLVIGGTGDNATPYEYAKWMAEELESAVLVTRDGVGHGSFGAGSSCIDELVVKFLTQGTVPASGIVCAMD
ncbi:MAG: alpha/beta hydrolase [Propionibacteriaceae bacterium]|jgi:pimeloyl-ACP methyl ester carboxylesterase|nr:alpha/beta hydrolase [Propionibacteriaceae bacterium]